jgi:hypothetical protein
MYSYLGLLFYYTALDVYLQHFDINTSFTLHIFTLPLMSFLFCFKTKSQFIALSGYKHTILLTQPPRTEVTGIGSTDLFKTVSARICASFSPSSTDSKQFFSVLSITSYSSFAFHKVSVAIYNSK